MKICFITYSIFDLGGIQRVVSVIASELSKSHEVDILCTSEEFKINRNLYNLDKNVNVELNSNLINKHNLTKIYTKVIKVLNKKTGVLNKKKYVNYITNIYYPKEVQNKFSEYLNSKKYDVVIGVAGEYSLLLGIIQDNICCKTIGWQHNSFDAYLKSKGRYFWNQDELFNKYILKLDQYIVLTNYDKEMFEKIMGIKSTVIYNPRSFNSKEKSSVEKKQFLAAGRFNYQKGFDLLIESFKEFSSKNKEWNLVIVGEGEEKEKILKLISKYGLNDKVKVEKFTSNIKKYFLDSSVLLLSSRWEGMPMIVLESMEMGVPIIAYNITATTQLIINNNEGILVDKFNTNNFANAMLNIAESYEKRLEMSKKCINKSNEFDIKLIADKWNLLFDNL